MSMNKYFYMAAIAAAAVAGAPNRAAAQVKLVAYWDFEKIEADGVSLKSVVGGHEGLISGSAILTEAGGGRPGGGKGFDVGVANPGWLQVENGDAPNEASAEDQMSVVLWQKNYSNINSSSFWGHSDSAGGARGFQFHIPWSDGTIYFDTQGCCGANTRLNKGGSGFDAWHHYAFIKDGDTKRIYIDGELFAEQSGYDPLTADYSKYTVGGADNASPPDAIIDDFAIFRGALSEDNVKAIAAGSRPDTFLKDTDGDGLPDDWETKYGFNPNSSADKNADPDKDGCDNVCEYAAGTDPNDTFPPSIVSANTTASFDTVVLTFSEKLDPTVAANTAHYSFSPSLAVTAAAVKGGTVTLTTAKQAAGQTYVLTVNNVTDLSKNKVATDSKVTVYSYVLQSTGVLKFSAWSGITGAAVQDLYNDARFPAEPEVVAGALSFNSRTVYADDSHENYGGMIEGVYTAPESGDFDFFLRSDDGSELLISTDDKPENLGVVAFELGCCDGFKEPTAVDQTETTASPITLVKGKKYFIRAVYKEGGGGDYVQVAMRKTTDGTPASLLTPLAAKDFSVAGGVPVNPQGAFLAISPAVGAKGVLPNTKIQIQHFDGLTALTSANTSLKFNDVTVPAVVTKEGNVLSVSYDPGVLLASGSVNSVSFTYLDAGGNPASLDYTFTVSLHSGQTKDKVGSYPGLILNKAEYTADAGGHTGKAGDYAINLTMAGGPVVSMDSKFLAAANAATEKDEFSVAFWQKKLDIADSSAFTLHSVGSGNNRGFHSHTPWSNQHIYFDTVGCCDGSTQRIEAGIDTFAGYEPADAGYWTNSWHLFVFTKKADQKNVYIDGQLFLNGSSSNPLPKDHIAFYMGSGAGGAELSHAIIDDFSVYGKELTEANALALFNGTLPTALPAATGLLAYWDYNDYTGGVVTAPTLSISGVVNGKITLTFDGTLQSADTVGGAYSPVVGTSPLTVDVNSAAKFYRAVK